MTASSAVTKKRSRKRQQALPARHPFSPLREESRDGLHYELANNIAHRIFDVVELEAAARVLGAPAESDSFVGTARRVTSRVGMCSGASKLSCVHDEILFADWPSLKETF